MSPVLSPLMAPLSFSALDICFQGEVIVSCLHWLSDICRTVSDFRARSPLFDWRLIVEQVYWRFWPNWRKFYHIYSRSRRQFLCWCCNLLLRCDTEASVERAVVGMLADCLPPYYCYNLLSLPPLSPSQVLHQPPPELTSSLTTQPGPASQQTAFSHRLWCESEVVVSIDNHLTQSDPTHGKWPANVK